MVFAISLWYKFLLLLEYQYNQIKSSSSEGDGCKVAISAVYREYDLDINFEGVDVIIRNNIDKFPMIKLIIEKLNIDINDFFNYD